MVSEISSHSSIHQRLDVRFGKVSIYITLILLGIIGITIFQDFLESVRRGYPFVFGEALLFKTFWFLFIPILTILRFRIKKQNTQNIEQTILLILVPIIVHIFLVPLIAVFFSVLFFEGRYDLFKFFSYTLSHDLYKLIIIYAGFVFGHQYFKEDSIVKKNLDTDGHQKKIVINNGKDNVIISSANIFQITAATPYVIIHTENEKYLHSETLKSILGSLEVNNFIRVHKSTIINAEKVKSYKSRLNGDYDVQLVNGEFIRLSRTFVRDFKKRFFSTSSD